MRIKCHDKIFGKSWTAEGWPPRHVAIIGSGSAAFACAIKTAENGARVTIIEAAEVIGGCCVNVGCVPSKILIRAAQLAEQQRHTPFDGLENREPLLDRTLLARQQVARVEELRAAKYQAILDTNPALSLVKGHASSDLHRPAGRYGGDDGKTGQHPGY